MRRFILGTSLTLFFAASASHLQAQTFTTSHCESTHNDGSFFFGGNAHACEVRTATLPLVKGHLTVSGKNGSIDVLGEDRHDILLEAQVETQRGATMTPRRLNTRSRF